jgi:hypothetical protein
MLLDWYNNGLAEAYIIFEKKYSAPKGTKNFDRGIGIKKEFEKLQTNGNEFEKFLDKYEEEPFGNVRIKIEKGQRKPYYDLKNLFPRSSKQRIKPDKDFWKVINFTVDLENEKCSICGSEGVKKNTVLLYPFERKIVNYFPSFKEKDRLKLCMLHQKICFYSFGNIFYNMSGEKPDYRVSIFYPSSEDFEKIATLAKRLQQIRISNIENNFFQNIRPEGISTYYPYEFLYPSMFSFYCWSLGREKEKREIVNVLSDVKVELVSYLTGKLDIFDTCASITRLDDLFRIFDKFDRNLKVVNGRTRAKGKKSFGLKEVFNRFFNNLTIDGKNFEDKNKLREQWIKCLLQKHKVDYITLNEIVMDNIRTQWKKGERYRFIGFYNLIIKSILEVINMDELKMFEQVNGMGYSLGKRAEDTLGESVLWDVFRTRTAEDFIETLVRTQVKMRTSLDLRKIQENKSQWREVKAILLNGMANALFARKEEGTKKERGGK